MKKLLLVISFLFLFSSNCFSQLLVDHHMSGVEYNLKRDFKNYKNIFTKTDTSITMVLRDSCYKPLDIYCRFNKRRNCISQKMSFNCDTCFNIFYNELLGVKKFEWQLINNDSYISSKKHLMLVGDKLKLYYTITLIE